jgi:hypothetical protein
MNGTFEVRSLAKPLIRSLEGGKEGTSNEKHEK